MKSLSYLSKLFQAMLYFRGFAYHVRQPIYFRRQSAADSIQIRHVFCFGAHLRAQPPNFSHCDIKLISRDVQRELNRLETMKNGGSEHEQESFPTLF